MIAGSKTIKTKAARRIEWHAQRSFGFSARSRVGLIGALSCVVSLLMVAILVFAE
jgi:hypothetical protein